MKIGERKKSSKSEESAWKEEQELPEKWAKSPLWKKNEREWSLGLISIQLRSRHVSKIVLAFLDAIRSHWFPYLLVPANKH